MPTKSLPGGSSAMPRPSTPSVDHALRARVGPRSGPPCFLEPPTTVGAISSAFLHHALEPFQPLAAIRSNSLSPTVCGGTEDLSGHEKCSAYCFRTATKTTRGRSCDTPKSDAFISFHPVW